jgi:hypothetical protein
MIQVVTFGANMEQLQIVTARQHLKSRFICTERGINHHMNASLKTYIYWKQTEFSSNYQHIGNKHFQ